MKDIDKRVRELEKSYGSSGNDFPQMSDEGLEDFIREQSEALGYRLAKPGEVVKVPEMDHSLLRVEVTDLNDEQLDDVVKYGLAEDGYVPISGGENQ